MTAYLLDTHALLWLLGRPERLGAAAREVLARRTTDVAVSAATAWEISTKHRLGKLPEAARVVPGYAGHLRRLGVATLPIRDDHALHAGALVWDHRDPFDRIIAAQAIIEGRALVTLDPAFSQLGELTTLW